MSHEPAARPHAWVDALGSHFADAEREVAAALMRLAHQCDPEIELAVALAVRAPRMGHVCARLDALDPIEDLRPTDPALAEASASPANGQAFVPSAWPRLDTWLEKLRGCPLVREASDGATESTPTPLVLDGAALYLDRYFGYEARLASALRERVRPPESADAPRPPDPLRLRARLDALFGTRDPDAAAPVDRQRLAATVAALRPFSVVAGGPGTGKTTTVRRILALLFSEARDQGREMPRVGLAAPTGKAAARLADSLVEALDELPIDPEDRAALGALEATTLHRLLGARPDSRTRFRHDARRPLPHDIVVVDEASMIPLSLMAKLFDAVRPDAKLILLGDRDQLASVEAGAVLGDLCGPPSAAVRCSRALLSELEAVEGPGYFAHEDVELRDTAGIWDAIVTLNRVHRFDPNSGIGRVSKAIARGDAAASVLDSMRARSGPAFADLEWIGNGASSDGLLRRLREFALEAYVPLIEGARAGTAPEQLFEQLAALRFLCAHTRGPLGVEGLGRRIESWLHEAVPAYDPRAAWPLGRPLMVLQNDPQQRLYNGDVGLILRHPEDPERTVVAFPDPQLPEGFRWLSPMRIGEHTPVFAMSIHKSQGSQFGHAVVVLPARSSAICTRELVYTGLTRARKRATLVGETSVLRTALDRRVQRASGLASQLW